jgi:hypothetical protein
MTGPNGGRHRGGADGTRRRGLDGGGGGGRGQIEGAARRGRRGGGLGTGGGSDAEMGGRTDGEGIHTEQH